MGRRINLAWAGGEHDFELKLGQLRALQDACDAGPETLLRRMAAGDWRIDDLIETIRLGLMGAGMESKKAGPLVTRLFELYPLTEFRETAYRILGAALVGVEGDPVGEPLPAPTATGENGDSPVTTEPAR